MKPHVQMLTFNHNISVITRMFVKQIELGILDPRDHIRCEELNDFMFKYGHHLYSNDIRSYASLLGFLGQMKAFNPSCKVYSSKDLFKNNPTNNPTNN